MTKKDIIFSAICGFSVGWLVLDFVPIKYGTLYRVLGFVILPILSVLGLQIAEIIAQKFKFILQIAKFCLAGGFADVVDVKVLQFLFFIFPVSAEISLIYKAISFLVGTFVKYFSDKYWTFEKHEKKDMHKEMAKFFIVAIAGSLINLASFYFFVKMKTNLPFDKWQEISNILAALVTAVWNFCGYKFLVFKK